MSLFGDITGFINSGRASKSVSDANIAAEHGVLDATTAATGGIQSQIGKAYTDVGNAGANINTATSSANGTLQTLLDTIQGNAKPYMAAGQQGVQGLQDYAASNPQFNFDPSKYINSDAYNFELKQGQDAISNAASVGGFGGNTLKNLTTYGQGLASTYYNNAFNQAQSQFQTNQNTTLQNLSALINTGTTGTQMSNQAYEALGGQQASNTVNAATSNASLQQFLASLGLQGQEASGAFSMQGAKQAGDYAIGAGQAHAGGILAQGNNLTAGVADLGSLIQSLLAGGGK